MRISKILGAMFFVGLAFSHLQAAEKAPMKKEESGKTRIHFHVECQDDAKGADVEVQIFSDKACTEEITKAETVDKSTHQVFPSYVYSFVKEEYIRFRAFKGKKEYGTYTTTIAELLGKYSGFGLARLRYEYEDRGFIQVNATPVDPANPQQDILLSVKTTTPLDAKDKKMFGLGKGTSDPYFILKRKNAAGEWYEFFRSQVVYENLKPEYKEIVKSIDFIQGQAIQVEVWDEDKVTKHDLIGTCEIPAQNFLNNKTFEVKLINSKNKTSGVFLFTPTSAAPETAAASLQPSGFFARVMGEKPAEPIEVNEEKKERALSFNLTVAVDFTGSNGHPADRGTLHFHQTVGGTPYEQAMIAVANILAPYDDDQFFMTYGFGAVIGVRGNDANHCFPLTQNPCEKTEGLKSAYQDQIDSVMGGGMSLSGPTYFAPVLTQVIKDFKKLPKEKQLYQVLLLLTDGGFEDKDATIKAINEAAKFPISIVIVGVGQADFSAMDGLDKLNEGKSAGESRDIVQFVRFNKHQGNPKELAAEVLAEIPAQVESYYQSR